jgi:hypothetical protein
VAGRQEGWEMGGIYRGGIYIHIYIYIQGVEVGASWVRVAFYLAASSRVHRNRYNRYDKVLQHSAESAVISAVR